MWKNESPCSLLLEKTNCFFTEDERLPEKRAFIAKHSSWFGWVKRNWHAIGKTKSRRNTEGVSGL